MSDGSGSKVEIERKYSVGADFAVPDLSAMPGVAAVTSPQTYHLTAIYHDTPGFRLAAAHITLRRRTGGTDAGWHLKLPAGAARREVHAPLGAGTGGVPAELASLVADVTGGEPLRPIARLRTTRTVRHLLDVAGEVLAEVADDHVRGSLPGPAEARAAEARATGEAEEAGATHEAGATGEVQAVSWREASAWREVEVELDAGMPDLLDAAEPLLFAAGARPSPAASKLSLLLTAAGALPG